VHLLGFIITIYHDTQSSECQVLLPCLHEPPTGPCPAPQEFSQYPPILPSCLSKIQLNIIVISMPTSLPFIFPSKALYIFIFSLLQILVLFSMHFSPSSQYLLPLGPKYLPQAIYSHTYLEIGECEIDCTVFDTAPAFPFNEDG